MIEISVVVPSHGRAQRLRRLLDALAAQTLPADRFEVIVVHDNPDEEGTEELLRAHPVVARQHRLPVGTGTPARQRNVGWRDARAPTVAFTDDDCRPEAQWLERLLAAPDGIRQGTTRPDPQEAHLLERPRVRTLNVDPPTPECPTCNVAYPRAALELVGGFDERFPGPAGEDTDLAERVKAATGAPVVPVAEAVVFHAVETFGRVAWIRMLWKWHALAWVVKRHPHLRARGSLRIFWKPSHWQLLLALVAVGLAPRSRLGLVLAVPYLRADRRHLATRVVTDAVEIAACAYGSAHARTLWL